MNFKGVLNLIKLITWISIPFVLWVLPSDLFDNGQSICLSQVLLDKECPGCGITRSVQHAMHFEIMEAWNYNKLFIVVLPFLFYVWVKVVVQLYKKLSQ